MKKVMIGGAGGAPSEGVIFSLKQNPDFKVIGIGADETDLYASSADIKRKIPYSDNSNYLDSLARVIEETRPDFIHFQNDNEILKISENRKILEDLNVKYFMPSHETVDRCVFKYKSYLAFKKAGLKVPENLLLTSPKDLRNSFRDLGSQSGKIWLRSAGIGGGGQGSLSTDNFDFAKSWIDFHKGWGDFLAAELLSTRTVTWLSLWHQGNLIVAQTRLRRGWIHGSRAVSGVTGVTKLGVTYSDPNVDEIALKAIMAVDSSPHGIYGVDMTYDHNDIPNPTEINISRFFTTIRFFTEAGLNMPDLFVRIGLGMTFNAPVSVMNPLENDLYWLRGMDREPMLASAEQLGELI